MKITLFPIFLVLMYHTSFSQKTIEFNRTSTEISLIVSELDNILLDIDSILKQPHIRTVYFNNNQNQINFKVITDSSNYHSTLTHLRKFGFVEYEKMHSNYYLDSSQQLIQEKDLLIKEKMQYEKLVGIADSTDLAKYFDYFEKIIRLEKQIADKEMVISNITNNQVKYALIVHFKEDEIVGQDYNQSWVNMPGLEASYLITEQATPGVSPAYMMGINLKYLINYKKTYFVMGLYKSPRDNSQFQINEMYTFAIGQDFYSKKLGRGQRKFFNLYTSFNAGVYLSSSENNKSNSWFVNPYIGLEIFKTKNILIDNKVGYFLPFQNNRFQRGLLYNISLNFVF